MAIFILCLYTAFMVFIFAYSLVQGHLMILYLKKDKQKAEFVENDFEPIITVQLPVYNEKYVVERLIDQIVTLDYPKHKLEIQVLDDSTDDTLEITKNKVSQYKAQGFDIVHLTRKKNTGFKAGALQVGLDCCKGDFVAIFDADFLPERDFLKKTVKHFINPKIGVVQTRWAHLNENYSLITQLQAFGLDAHFTVEQSARNFGNHFINFNGTAGVWRKETIYDAGSWQSDTITEDLDLSYRAQMKGWRFLFLEEVGCPAELPVAMNALKNQQFRWTKGAAETAKKNLIRFWKTPGISFGTKIHGTFHLLNSFLFVSILGTSLLSVPILYIKQDHPEWMLFYKIAGLLIASLLILATYYFIAQKRLKAKSTFFPFLKKFPLFLSISMGLSLHNAIAVIEGYFGIKSPFVRTPKFAITSDKTNWSDKKQYLKSTFNALTLLELLMYFYAVFGIYSAFILNDFGLFPFHCMLALGYGYVAYYSYKHSTQ